MASQHSWNHNNYAVPPESLQLVEACLDALFPWEKFVNKPHLLGYRLGDDLHAAALYIRPATPAARLHEVIARLRTQHADLDGALTALERIGVTITSVPVMFWARSFAHSLELMEELTQRAGLAPS